MKFVQATKILEEAYIDFISEWEDSGELIVPMSVRRNGMSFDALLESWAYFQSEKAYEMGFVPSTTYFLVDEQLHIKGALNFRHELNENLLIMGGHIGYGVRPSERGKGYAVTMLKLGLEIAHDRDIEKVLITCDDSNIPSYKVIEKCGGVLENTVLHDEKMNRRYWIEVK